MGKMHPVVAPYNMYLNSTVLQISSRETNFEGSKNSA